MLPQISRAYSEPASHVARAKALLAVSAGQSYRAAAQAAGQYSGDTVSQWVARFNHDGLTALEPRHSGGPPRRYGVAEQERILLGGSWLNMAESIQGIIEHRALDGQHPATPQAIIDGLEAAVQGWNRHPTPFVWGGKRAARRERARKRRQALAGSGACIRRVCRHIPITEQLQQNGGEHVKRPPSGYRQG